MIEPDGAGVAHRGAQHLPERLELPRLQGNRIEGRQTPILPGGVVEVGRRSYREPGHDGILIAPGIEAVRLHPDRDVEIKPDRQSQVLRALPAGGELLIGHPLHELEIADGLAIAVAQLRQRRLGRISPLRRPLRPGRAEPPAQEFEAGKPRQDGPAFAPESFRTPRARRIRAAKIFVSQRQRPRLGARYARVIDQLALRKLCHLVLEPGGRKPRKFRDRIDIDIERIEKQPAVGRVRARGLGAIVE